MVKMYTLIITAAIVVGLAFWVAAARLLRKLYRVSRKEARWLRLKDEGSNDNEPVITELIQLVSADKSYTFNPSMRPMSGSSR